MFLFLDKINDMNIVSFQADDFTLLSLAWCPLAIFWWWWWLPFIFRFITVLVELFIVNRFFGLCFQALVLLVWWFFFNLKHCFSRIECSCSSVIFTSFPGDIYRKITYNLLPTQRKTFIVDYLYFVLCSVFCQ